MDPVSGGPATESAGHLPVAIELLVQGLSLLSHASLQISSHPNTILMKCDPQRATQRSTGPMGPNSWDLGCPGHLRATSQEGGQADMGFHTLPLSGQPHNDLSPISVWGWALLLAHCPHVALSKDDQGH